MSTKEEVFNYVMNTPGNTNPAVLKSLLDGMEGGSLWDGTATGLSEGSGDITVSYNGAVLGSLSDTGAATLKTENTIVQGDIEVEYTKPSSGINLPTLTLDAGPTYARKFSTLKGVVIGAQVDDPTKFYIVKESGGYYIPEQVDGGGGIGDIHFTYRFSVASTTDNLTVTLNGNPVSYDSQEQAYIGQVLDDNAYNDITIYIGRKSEG